MSEHTDAAVHQLRQAATGIGKLGRRRRRTADDPDAWQQQIDWCAEVMGHVVSAVNHLTADIERQQRELGMRRR